jgi:peptide/nickel transport system substrate-binding protein
VARGAALTAAIVAALLAVSGAGGAATQQTPKRGGTLVLAGPASPLTQESACLNVLVPRCFPGLIGTIAPRVLEPAFDVGPDLTWRPRLVSKSTFTRTEPYTLTYHIRPKASWSDGVPVTARDFVFTHNAVRRLGAPDDWHRTQVRSVRAVDASTVRVVLRSRRAGWQGALFWIIFPSHALRGQALTEVWTDRIDNPKTGEPIASGPFLVERWSRGRQLSLVRNPRYWGGLAQLDRLVFRFGFDVQDLIPAFKAHQIQLAWGLPPGFVADLQRERELKVETSPGSNLDLIWIRMGPGGHRALRQKLVRRALAYSIDRVALVRGLLASFDSGQRVVDSTVFPAQSRYYKPNWSAYRSNPALARRLLSQAGCVRGTDGIYMCDGQRLRLRFVTAGIPGGYRVRMIELLPPQLRQVGVELVPTNATNAAYFQQILPSGDFDLALHSIPLGSLPTARLSFGCGGPFNSGGYCQRLVTGDLEEAERILDVEQQARVLNRADTRIARDVPVIPFAQMPQSAARVSAVRGFQLSVNAQANFLWNAEDWWLDR